MSSLSEMLLLTPFLFVLFLNRINSLLKKRRHSDYLFLFSISILRIMIIISLYIISAALLFDIFNGGFNKVMEIMMMAGLLILFVGILIPFFFLQQIEITDTVVTMNNDTVSWGLKKFSNQKECVCYIRIYFHNREDRLYMVINLKNLSRLWKRKINITSETLFPSTNRERRLIDILDFNKKDSTLNFLSKGFKVAIGIVISMMFLSIIVNS